MSGDAIAFEAEFLISFLMMSTVLMSSNSKRASRWTPCLAATLVFLFITLESPLSGMSMNPARTLGSAAIAGEWRSIWVYFTAPTLGMGAAGLLFRFRSGVNRVFCAKLHHHTTNEPCIFNCRYGELHGK